MPTLRLLTYNVRSMRDDRAALARVIRSTEADVVAVQEAPRFLRWRSTCAALARTSNMVVVGGGRPAGANLIMSTLGVDELASTDVLFSKRPKLHQRGAAIAQLKYRGSTFALVGVHGSLHSDERLLHLGELEAAIARIVPPEVPVIVAGDVNDQPGSAVWSTLAAERPDAFDTLGIEQPGTYPASGGTQTIDGVFVDRRIKVTSAQVVLHPDAPAASDHLPVLVELELPES